MRSNRSKPRRTRAAQERSRNLLSLISVIFFAFLYFSIATAKPRAKPYKVRPRAISQFKCYSGSKLPEKSVLSIQPSIPFGRLGNVFLVFMFAALEAWENSCHLELPPVLESLPGWQSNCNLIYNNDNSKFFSRFNSGTESCSTRDFKYFGSKKRDSRLLTQDGMKFVYDILGLYTGTNETHAYGNACDEASRIAVHVRGGDIVKGYFASDGTYIQQVNTGLSSGVLARTPFATAYYLKVIESLLDANPRVPLQIFFEDTFSPSYGMLHPLHTLANTQIHVGRPLLDDLKDLTCSHELVSSRGSFLYPISIRYKFQRVHFQSDSAKSPYRCHLPNAQGYYLANDTAYSTMAQQGWFNSVQQRDVLNRDFAVRSSKCVTCTDNANCVL
jgi:hypothetical protein